MLPLSCALAGPTRTGMRKTPLRYAATGKVPCVARSRPLQDWLDLRGEADGPRESPPQDRRMAQARRTAIASGTGRQSATDLPLTFHLLWLVPLPRRPPTS